ncbi:MAG: hypothetical protein JJU15_07750 [Pararhodobacter sp.]|nr:hypothetical protein [Pararhodobacter sp.]
MQAPASPLAMTVLALGGLALAGCGSAAAPSAGEAALGAPENAIYRGVHTRLLDDELVNFLVTMEGARGAEDVITYARCAAAQYAVIRGYGFARHVRTNVAEQGGIWQADAVYTVSPALPRGFRTIDAEVTVADCTEQGIPTV